MMIIELYGDEDVSRVAGPLTDVGFEVMSYTFDDLVKTGGNNQAINILIVSDNGEQCINQLEPGVNLDIVISKESTPALMRQTIRLGAKDLLTVPLLGADLKESIEQVIKDKLKEMGNNASNDDHRDCTVSAFINAKGGAGATFIATNVAHYIAGVLNKPTTYLDLDLQFSSASSYLNVDPPHSLISALNAGSDLDQVAVRGYFSQHKSTLNTLTAKKNELPLLEEVSSGKLEQLLTTLKSINNHVVIDLPRYLNLLTASTLEQVDNLYVVLQQNLSQLGDAVKLVRVLRDDLQIPDDKIHFIINRYSLKSDISLNDIQNALKTKDKDMLTVCNDFKLVTSSMNEAKEVYVLNERARISKDIAHVASIITNDNVPKESRFIQRLFKNQME